jgi:hypothetical protein
MAGLIPRQDVQGSPYEPTQAGAAWGDDLQREQDQRSPAEVAAVQDDVGGFGNSSAGSVVEWNVPAAKVFFNDLITGDSVAGTA